MNPELTTAVAKPSQNHNLDRKMDSQSEKSLENLENLGPSNQLVIGLGNSRQGGREQSSRWGVVLENQTKTSNLEKKL